eukprot:PLAT12477.7.p2 GENE.PLAT12477.7~~PLAT12477.7.p2  ORF type:complete len:705 (-),score=370.78 PLAT12477.7:654-2726(-)
MSAARSAWVLPARDDDERVEEEKSGAGGELVPEADSARTMSVDELRRVFGTRLERGGELASIKARLRWKFCSELLGRRDILPSRAPLTLNDRIVGSLFADHLEKAALPNSLAVFLPEARLASSLLSANDVVQALSLPEDGLLARQLLAAEESGTSLIVCVMEQLAAAATKRTTACGTQTDGDEDESTLLHRQLRAVHDDYMVKSESERAVPAATMEERMLAFQRDCEARYADQLAEELERMRTSELNAMRLEESIAYRQQLESARTELQREYEARFRKLKARDEERSAFFQRREREVESARYEHRQRVLSEMESLRIREADATRKADLEGRALRAMEQRVADKERRLDVQLRELEGRRATLAREAAEQLRVWKEEERDALTFREDSLRRERARFEEEVSDLQAERDAAHKLKVTLRGVEEEVEAQRRQLAAAAAAADAAAAEMAQLRAQLRHLRSRRVRCSRRRRQLPPLRFHFLLHAAQRHLQLVRGVTLRLQVAHFLLKPCALTAQAVFAERQRVTLLLLPHAQLLRRLPRQRRTTALQLTQLHVQPALLVGNTLLHGAQRAALQVGFARRIRLANAQRLHLRQHTLTVLIASGLHFALTPLEEGTALLIARLQLAEARLVLTLQLGACALQLLAVGNRLLQPHRIQLARAHALQLLRQLIGVPRLAVALECQHALLHRRGRHSTLAL